MIPEFKFVLDEGLDDSFLPTRSEPNATGWDVRCAEKNGVVLRPFDKALINLGFRAFLPYHWWAELKPRSSTFAKKALHCLYGTIDETYSHNWRLAVQWIPPVEYLKDSNKLAYVPNLEEHLNDNELKIDFGERIGQIIPVKRQDMQVFKVSVEEFEKLCSERTGNRAGFGSSGDK
jgi:dUTPase